MNGKVLIKAFGIGVSFVALTAAPLFAQESAVVNPRGYASVFAGPVWGGGNSTGSVVFEGGARIVRRVMVFGNIGRYADLQADLQPTLDAATTALSNQGVSVTGVGSLPAWYGVGGLRGEIPASKHALPYFLGGIGAARLNPTTQFTFTSGSLPDGSVPDVGTDVTTALMSEGSYTTPVASTEFMFMLGGGVQVPLPTHWAIDLGYRYSRIAADETLSATALNTNAMTFGFGYRF